MRKTLLTTLAVLLIAGCASDSGSVNMTRYDLLDGVAPASYMGIKNLRVRMYGLLSDDGIVIQTSPVTLRPARHHCWQWDISQQLAVLLSEALLAEGVQPQAPLLVNVSRFNGTLEGTVTVAAAVQVEGQTQAKEYHWQSKQTEPGYDALVAELKRGWQELSAQMAKDLKNR